MPRKSLTPLTGVLFIALVVAAFAIGGEPPDADEPVQEIVSHYVDNKDSVSIGAFLAALAATALLFFANHLRSVFRHAEPAGGELSTMVLVGATVMAVGIAIDSTILLALADAAEDVDPVAVQALQALWDADFVPIATGSFVLVLASGLSILRHGALPKWLGWVAILLAILGPTPLGFFAFLGSAAWILVVSGLLFARERPAAPAAPPPPAA